jgi:hypothetical protein
MSGIMGLVSQAKELRKHVDMLRAQNTPLHEADRKQALIELTLAEVEANRAEAALEALNPYQTRRQALALPNKEP